MTKQSILQGDVSRCVRVLRQNGLAVREVEIRRPDGSASIARVQDGADDDDTPEDYDPIMRMIDEASKEQE